jgi:hypothetical protein
MRVEALDRVWRFVGFKPPGFRRVRVFVEYEPVIGNVVKKAVRFAENGVFQPVGAPAVGKNVREFVGIITDERLIQPAVKYRRTPGSVLPLSTRVRQRKKSRVGAQRVNLNSRKITYHTTKRLDKARIM